VYNRRMTAITPEEARDYLDRWALVQAVELEELRRTPMDTKLRQLASLMASREQFTEDLTGERRAGSAPALGPTQTGDGCLNASRRRSWRRSPTSRNGSMLRAFPP